MKSAITIFLSFICIQCNTQEQVDKCHINNEKSARCILEYQMTGNTTCLDSALFYINEVFGACQNDYGLALRKVAIYTEKRDYEQAIDFIDSLDRRLYYLPYYKNLVLNRVKAMKAQSEGDPVTRNKFINAIILEVGDYMVQHKNEIDSFIKLPNIQSILTSRFNMIPIQYYYYKSMVEGIDKTKSQVDSLQRAISGNEEYFEMIKGYMEEDFMVFKGF